MQIIQRPKSGVQEFNEAMQPYLALAFQNMLQRKMEKEKAEREQPYEIQKALISSGLLVPTDQNTNLEIGGMKFQPRPSPYDMIYGKTGGKVGTRQRGFGTQMSGIGAEGKPTFTADTPQEVFNRTYKLRNEFIDRPEVKDYVTIKTQVGAMDNLLQYASTGAPNVNNPLDQALIMTYNKILDPTSVVRESEYARTPENLSTVNRIQGAIEKFSEGGAGLTAEDRQALVLGAKIIADERGKRFNEALKGYQKTATSAAVVPQDVIRGFRPHKKFQKPITQDEMPTKLKLGEQFMGKKIIAIEPYKGD